jgi:predicted CopG family antitoxin
MKNIDIDFEVFKELTSRLQDENDTYNEVIRRLVGLPVRTESPGETNGEVVEWISKGHGFPEGTQFRATFNGELCMAEIKGGKLYYNGKRYKSFSGAAYEITKQNRNGWNFWEQKRPGTEKWIRLY